MQNGDLVLAASLDAAWAAEAEQAVQLALTARGPRLSGLRRPRRIPVRS
jgi:hypothetical protein